MSEKTNTLITFLDTVGRTVMGVHNTEKSTDAILAITNPVVLHVEQQDQSGRMSVKFLPIFFREFLGDKQADICYFYKKANITESDINVLDFRLKAQYDQMFNSKNVFVPPTETQAPANTENSPIINLFDE